MSNYIVAYITCNLQYTYMLYMFPYHVMVALHIACCMLYVQTMKNPDLLTDIPELSNDSPEMDLSIHPERQRFPFCIVWTPLPLLT